MILHSGMILILMDMAMKKTGNLADDCPNVWGDSWRNNTLGCFDTDQDGWADNEDAQPK